MQERKKTSIIDPYETDMKKLNQQEYSNFIQKNLEQIFPEFIDFYRHEDDIYILEYPSGKKELILWISTQDDELSIGLDRNSECIWHTHMSLFGAYEPENELKEAIEFINGLFDGRQIIVINEKNEIYVTDTKKRLVNLGTKCFSNHGMTFNKKNTKAGNKTINIR